MGIIIVQDTLPGFPHTPFHPVDVPRRPQAAESKPQPPSWGAAGRSPQGGHRSSAARRRQDTKPPSPGRHRAASPGRWAGCGAGGPLAPRAAAGTSPKRTTGGPQTGGRPHPAAGPLGGPPPGEVGLGAGGARTQARPPTPRPGGRSQRPGHRHHGRAPRRGGCGPPHPGGQQRDRTQADHGPGAPPPATSQHQRRRGPTGRGRTRPGRCDWGGGGRAGPVPARPAPDRPHTFYVCPSGANSAAGARAPNRDGGAAGLAPGGLAARAAGGTDRSRGHPSRSWGGVGGKKNAGRLAPRLDTTGRKKMRGGRFVPPACRHSGYQISPCSA